VRQSFYELRLSHYWDLGGRLETRQIFMAPLNFQTESGEHIEFNLTPTRDILPFDFEVSDGVILPKGPYNYTTYEVEVETASRRPVAVDLEQRFGTFYSGHLNQTELGLVLKYRGFATLEFRADIVRGRLPQGRFKENVYEVKADLFLSPRLGLMNYFQYDDVSKELGINTRFRWEIAPGNIIYLVYSKNWERRWDPMSRFVPLEETGVFKIQLSIRP